VIFWLGMLNVIVRLRKLVSTVPNGRRAIRGIQGGGRVSKK
jgi:hypothetical protein